VKGLGGHFSRKPSLATEQMAVSQEQVSIIKGLAATASVGENNLVSLTLRSSVIVNVRSTFFHLFDDEKFD
jgi:hypothetical protein